MLFTRPLMSIHDKRRLATAIEQVARSRLSYAPHIDSLRAELRRARLVLPDEVPADMITMNSRSALQHAGEDGPICYTLVYPEAESVRQGKISVLSPMGRALLGARVGDTVCWMSPAGPEVAVVKRLLYQPEAAGDHHL